MSDWGDDFEFEYDFEEDDTVTPDDPKQDDVNRLESLFCDAEDARRDDPQKALSLLKEVATVDSEGFSDKANRLVFSAAVETCLLAAKLQSIDELTTMLSVLLDKTSSVGFSVVASALQQVTSEALASFADLKREDMLRLTECFEGCLGRVAHHENARFVIQVKLLEFYLRTGSEVKFNAALQELFDYFDSVDSEEAGFSFDSLVLEVCILNLRFAERVRQVGRMRRTLARMKKLKWTLNDPRTQAVVHTSTATINVSLGNYDSALAEFYKAIQAYQAAGLHAQALATFSKLVVMSILGQSKLSPFESTESKVYADKLGEAKELRRLFDEGSVDELSAFLSRCDAAFSAHKDHILHIKRTNILVRFFQDYSSATVADLKRLVGVDEDAHLMQILLCLPTSEDATADESVLIQQGASPPLRIDLLSGRVFRHLPPVQTTHFALNSHEADLEFYASKLRQQQQRLLATIESATI